MSEVKIHLRGRLWHAFHGNELAVRGSGFDEAKLLPADAFEDQLPKADADPAQWERALAQVNGFFALIRQSATATVAVVDRIRSVPLFYGNKDGQFYISDDAEWVQQCLGNDEMDPMAMDEFQLAGYVTNDRTLYPDVKQLLAGELIVFKKGQLHKARYYKFQHKKPKSFNLDTALDALNDVANDSIRRLMSYADGKQIVVPLSGGYDSRLIAALLTQNKYDNVLAFSYGTRDSKEAQYSKFVAENLNIRWVFAEYDKVLWSQWARSPDYFTFQKYCSNLTSVPHIQDCLAVSILKKDKVFQKEAIFSPGHCCVTSFLPAGLNESNKWTVNDSVEDLISRHYNLRPIESGVHLHRELLRNNISMYFGTEDSRDVLASRAMQFNWQERQAKFIANSIRLYEFYGYDWWMPLWDANFMTFWEHIPLKHRINRSLYVKYVNDVFYRNTSVSGLRNANAGNGRIKVFIKKLLKNNRSIVDRLKAVERALLGNDNFGWYGQFPVESSKLVAKGYGYNGLVGHYFLREISNVRAAGTAQINLRSNNFPD